MATNTERALLGYAARCLTETPESLFAMLSGDIPVGFANATDREIRDAWGELPLSARIVVALLVDRIEEDQASCGERSL